MAEIPHEDCKRGRFHFGNEPWYMTIAETSIQAHFPAEGSYENKDIKALVNALFRMMTKVRCGEVLTWSEIAERLTRSGVGHHCITDSIAKSIRDCTKEG